MAAKTEPLTPKQLALHLETDARTVRKFLRSKHGKVGQGKRWAISGTKKELTQISKDFEAWRASNARPIKDKVSATEPEVDDSITEELDIESELEDLDPTFEDLEDIEDLDLDLD